MRVGSTARTGMGGYEVERYLAKKLKRSAAYVDADPKLSGPVPSVGVVEQMSDADAWSALRVMRWPAQSGAPSCPKCGHNDAYTIATRMKFKCKSCSHQFSELSGTAFASFKGGRKALLVRIATGKSQNRKTNLDLRRRLAANTQ